MKLIGLVQKRGPDPVGQADLKNDGTLDGTHLVRIILYYLYPVLFTMLRLSIWDLDLGSSRGTLIYTLLKISIIC